MGTFKHTIFAVAVWGEMHRRRFTERMLPSLLAALPSDHRELRPRLVIFTTAEDWEIMKPHFDQPSIADGMQALMSRGHDKPDVIKFIPGSHNGTSMVTCQKEAVGIAFREKSALAWLYPDVWYMPGSYDAIAAKVAQHSRACMGSCISVTEADAARTIAAYGPPTTQADRDTIAWEVSKHIHRTSTARAWTEDGTLVGDTIHPGMLFRLPTPELPLLVMNAFHQSPLWVFPRRLALDFTFSLDGDFIEYTGLSIEEIDVMRRGFWKVECVEPEKVDAMEVDEKTGARIVGPLDPLAFKGWMRRFTTPINRMMFGVPVVLARDPTAKISPSAEAELLTKLAANAHAMTRV